MSCVSLNNNQGRNYGIDLLRITAMLGIVTIHTLYHGKVVAQSPLGTANYYISTFLQTAVWCAVDVFALISGFVGFSHKGTYRWAGFLRLWLQVVFYSAGISLLFYYLMPGSVSGTELVKSFAPLTTKVYWYFTAYFFVVLCAPILNTWVDSYPAKRLIVYSVLGGAVLYLSHLVPQIFGSVLLVYLYFVGACLGKYQNQIKFPNRGYMAAIVMFIGFTWLWGMYWDSVKPSVAWLWLRNDSPTILGVAICLVMLFGQIKLSHTLLISLITPGIFSVYLLNDHPLIRKYFITEHFTWLQQMPWYVLLGYVIGFSIVFFAAAVSVDMGRRQIICLTHLNKFIPYKRGRK